MAGCQQEIVSRQLLSPNSYHKHREGSEQLTRGLVTATGLMPPSQGGWRYRPRLCEPTSGRVRRRIGRDEYYRSRWKSQWCRVSD